MTKRNRVITGLVVLVSLAASPSVMAEGRFEVSGEGWLRDAETGLHWTTRDNQKDIDWHKAAAYCDGLELDQSSDWRLPTIEELRGIFQTSGWREPKSLELSRSNSWSSTRDDDASVFYFNFNFGSPDSSAPESSGDMRALCVRNPPEAAPSGEGAD